MALSKLCEQCSRIFAGTAPTSTSDESFIIHSSLATFWESIRASCHLCTILNSRWRSFLEATRPKAKTYRQHLEIHCRPGHQWQKLWFSLTSVDASQVIQPVIEAAATFELIPAAGKLMRRQADIYHPICAASHLELGKHTVFVFM